MNGGAAIPSPNIWEWPELYELENQAADRARAIRAARQEARGAGLVQFTLHVTTTVTDPADLEEAKSEVERAAGDSRLKLRVARGGQAAAFAAGLPVGVFPPDA